MARAHEQPIRITTAAESRQVDIAHRQRRYLISMSIRTLCFVGAVIAGINHVVWLWPILIVAALFLPYVAVVMANANNTKGATPLDLLDNPYGTPQLGAGDAQRDGRGEDAEHLHPHGRSDQDRA
jgi:hypothetical protein